MNMTAPEELVTQLDEFASEQDAKSEASLPAYSAGYRNEAKLIRAAAALIRELVSQQKELREALTPFADWAAHHRQSTHDHYVPECEIDGPGHSLTLILGDFRRAAKALEAK